MATVSQASGDQLIRLGRRLRMIRQDRGETMVRFAEYLDIPLSTLRSMERGRSGIPIGRWAEVLQKLKRQEELDLILSPRIQSGPNIHQNRPHRMRSRFTRPVIW